MASAADWDFNGKSPYEVLGLEKGEESTPDAIKKVGMPPLAGRTGGGRRQCNACAAAAAPAAGPHGAHTVSRRSERTCRGARPWHAGGLGQQPHAGAATLSPPSARPARCAVPPADAAAQPAPRAAAPPRPPSIAQAYRRLALLKHPDKAKTPNAAAEFAELQKAYALLSDADARAALDDYLRWVGRRGGGTSGARQ